MTLLARSREVAPHQAEDPRPALGPYREVIEGEALHDNIEALSRSFRGVWNGATLEEVRPVAEGTIETEESDNLM